MNYAVHVKCIKSLVYKASVHADLLLHDYVRHAKVLTSEFYFMQALTIYGNDIDTPRKKSSPWEMSNLR